MDLPLTEATGDQPTALIADLRGLVAIMQAHAVALDEHPMFPAEDLAALRGIGALAAPIPTGLGGIGIGTEPDGAIMLFDVLRLLGRGNLAVGRIYEGHVNALRLIMRFGTPRQQRRAADDARAGHLFAIWVTDDPHDPLRQRDGTLAGCKAICSAAGHATRALVTIDTGEAEPRMAVLALTGAERVRESPLRVQGMRAARSLPVGFDGLPIDGGDFLGAPGDYLREPDFSTGAWRTTAVTLGGLEALMELATRQLEARGRDADPHQRARIGRALIAKETARLWSRQAALAGESASVGPADSVAYVNLARLAVEAACLDAMLLVQRSLGLAAFGGSNPVERVCRDLATYLRQPAPDDALTTAAQHFMRRPMPGDA